MMAGAMNEVFLVALRANVGYRRLMNVADSHARLDFRDGGLLSVENNLIDLALARREFSRNRIGPRDIRAVAAVFGADITTTTSLALHPAFALVVVQNGRKGSRTHDRRKSRTLRPIAPKLILQRCLDFIFHDARSDGLAAASCAFNVMWIAFSSSSISVGDLTCRRYAISPRHLESVNGLSVLGSLLQRGVEVGHPAHSRKIQSPFLPRGRDPISHLSIALRRACVPGEKEIPVPVRSQRPREGWRSVHRNR